MISLPIDGTFLVFTFDPVASVAHLENPELTTACKELAQKQKKFVAFVEWDTIDRPVPQNYYNPFRFLLVWQGLEHLPQPMKSFGVQPNMLFPIMPNTHHPTSCLNHEPVIPQQPLPWPDCYMSGRVRLEVKLETEWPGPDVHDLADLVTAPYQTTLEEAMRVIWRVKYDADVYRSIREAVPRSVPLVADSSSSDFSSACEDMGASGDPGGNHAILSDRMIMHLTGYRELDEKFVVQCSTDLSMVDVINHPDELYQQLAYFERLKATLEVDRKRRLIEKARRIDDEYFANVQYPKPSRLCGCGFSLGFFKDLGHCVKNSFRGTS